jgi:hypothetical protein
MDQFDSPHWFLDAARYFRRLGFFESLLLTDEGIAEAIESYWGNDWRDYLSGVADGPAADQWFLVADTKRVWWHDLEGVYRGANYYPEVLQEWSAISREQFLPEQVQERWHSENGPVEITFGSNGKTYSFVHQSGDYLDHGILRVINQALPDKAFRFEVAIDYGDSNWISMLKPNEKHLLQTERGWQFL